ncbi:MAG: hypothetical protein ACREDH_12185 [Methylocella sp.]
MAKREKAEAPTKELETAIRARMLAAVVDLWSQCGIHARHIDVRVTLTDGRTRRQQRKLREGGA